MTINTDLLIAAPMLQDYLVDKDSGFPLANGLVTLYKDDARSFYKNWYYQTGTPGAYTWVALDNPMHLSSVGTIQDPNGNDVIPFYYPYEEDNENNPEPYYITVYSTDENGEQDVLQFTRENFPFLPSNVNPTATNPTWRNYILNNVYWRNIGSLDAMDVLDQVLAPSQHEGYTNGDIRFIKNVAGANDDIAFLPMTTTLNNDITPEYYLNFTCTGVQLGETVKCIQYPVSLHVKTLQNVNASLVIQAQNVAGNTNNFLDIYVYQYLGTGALSQPAPILIQRVVLNNTFQKYILPFIFPDAAGLSLGGGGDDALFIRVQYPLSALCQINHTKPQIYLSEDVPDNDFDTYDQIEAIINSPRTGDTKFSLNEFQPYGYVAANNGTIGNASSNATCRKNIDAWPLFNLIWNLYSKYSNGTVNGVAPMYTSAAAPVAYGASAIDDWNANKQLTVPATVNRALMATVPHTTMIPNEIEQTYTASNSAGNLLLTVSNNTNRFFTGDPVAFSVSAGGTLPGGLTANAIYYISIIPNNATMFVSTNIGDAYAGVVIPFTTAGTGTQTVIGTISGTSFGEFAHTQLVPELAAHHHNVPFSITPNVLSSGGGHNQVDAGPTDTSTTGSSRPFNIMQTSSFMNLYLKL